MKIKNYLTMKISEIFCSLNTTVIVFFLGALLITNTTVYAQNNSLDFDGVNDYVSLPASINNQITSNVTSEGWFYFRAVPGQFVQLIGERYDTSVGDSDSKFVLFSDGGGNISVGVVGQGSQLRSTGVPFPALNNWVHIAGTYDGITLRLYINGALSISSVENLAIPASNGPWILGKTADAELYYNGKMDEIRIWNTTRSAAEILANYKLQVAPTTPGLIANYQMNQGVAEGNNTGVFALTDSSLAPFDGTFSGFALAGNSSNFVTGIPTVYNAGWSQGTPDVTTDAIIEGNYSVAANLAAKTLTVNNGAIVTIPSGNNVTVTDAIVITAPASFTLSNNSNLIQVNNVVNTGDINVTRNSSDLFRLDFTMWSAPVLGSQSLGIFSPLTSTDRFYEYNTTSDLYSAVSNNISFGLAKGYLIRMPNTWVPFPGTAASWSGVFAGTPNNGNITFTMSTAGNGFNAVGNPYPSTLNIDNFIAGNSGNITGPLYFWRKKNDATNLTSYSTCTSAGCTLTNSHTYPNDNFISVGQGFIVKATSTTLNFTNSMRIANNTNQFFRTKAIEKNRIWLNLSDATSPINQMMVTYMTGATQGIDAAIDGKYINDSQTALNSLIGSEEYAIQGRSLPFDVTDVVPMAFKTTTAGNYTIAIDRVDGLFATGQDIYLVDSKTGTETNLKTGSYNFTAASGVDNTRFSVKYQRTLKIDASIFDENSVTVFSKNGSLYVNSGKMIINTIQVYDVQGRLIAERKNVKATSATLENLKVTNQVLLVKVSGANNQEITIKVVN